MGSQIWSLSLWWGWWGKGAKGELDVCLWWFYPFYRTPYQNKKLQIWDNQLTPSPKKGPSHGENTGCLVFLRSARIQNRIPQVLLWLLLVDAYSVDFCSWFVITKKTKQNKKQKTTRTHSSRMRTARFSSFGGSAHPTPLDVDPFPPDVDPGGSAQPYPWMQTLHGFRNPCRQTSPPGRPPRSCEQNDRQA